jgi:subtilisin family serine protease
MGAGNGIARTSIRVWVLVVGCGLLVGSQPGRSKPQSEAGTGVTAAPSAMNPAPNGSTGLISLVGRSSGSGPSVASGTYDAGESLRIGSRRIPLLRSQQKVAVIHGSTEGIRVASDIEQVETVDRVYRIERRISKPSVTVFQTRKFTSPDEQTGSMRQLEQQTAAGEVVPVYIHGDSGLEVIPTGKIVVKLKKQDDLAGLSTVNRRLGTRIERPIRGTADQYILSAPHSAAGELFDLCAILEREPAIEWAEPDFITQVIKHAPFTPNDPFFDPNQWYLKDIRAPQAWDIVTGSNQIIIAIVDDGMDLKHEDLKGALPSNAGEIAGNGLDNDHNGWVGDVNGWNFHDDNNDPGPGYLFDSHGTEVAGVAAATGNNGIGIAGCAFGCKLMPLKVLEGDPRQEKEDTINTAIAEALYYAAGQTADGHNRWRGADVISISLGFSETNLVNAALQFAAQQGRNGKGCPTFCASGNSASGWAAYRIYGIDAGAHHFRWEMVRDGSGSAGDNTVWLDSIAWPGGTAELFQNLGLPAGWKTGGDARWITVQNDAQGNHAMTGWTGLASRAVRPGPLDHWGRSFLDIEKTTGSGAVSFWVWSSLLESYPSLVGDSPFIIPDLWPFSLAGAPQNRRTQFICLRDELGWDSLTPLPIRELKFAEFQIVDAPSRPIDELTIRVKQIEPGRDRYDNAEWDEAGWTTVLHATNVPLDTGTVFDLPDGTRTNLIRFNFANGFRYDPNYNLAVDISMSETHAPVLGGLCLTSLTDETRAIVGEESPKLGPDSPVNWHDSYGKAQLTRWVPLMWLGSGDEMRFFVDGLLATKTSGVAQSKAGIAYPASNLYTIAVGACTDFGLRSDYSQYGPDLDFLAPSNGGLKSILTTDRMGLKGDDPGNYFQYFGGTSAATPLASGVAALMLSRNPNLTADQIRTILRQTCEKIGDEPYVAGRNDHFGYGRIDAKAAVTAAGTSQ